MYITRYIIESFLNKHCAQMTSEHYKHIQLLSKSTNHCADGATPSVLAQIFCITN